MLRNTFFVSFTRVIHQGLQATASSTTLQSNLLNSIELIQYKDISDYFLQWEIPSVVFSEASIS